jgi:NAD(P)-dependent dehydrogenase (short-subunit alcohol dehydrogenase family)
MKPKYALVTGVSRRLGLGFAVARQLAELNYHVILTARDVRQAEELAVELRQACHIATALRLDLADRTSINEDAEKLTEAFDHLDVLVTHPERGDDDEERSPAEAAKGVVWAATLDNDGPTGGLFFDGKPVSETAR